MPAALPTVPWQLEPADKPPVFPMPSLTRRLLLMLAFTSRLQVVILRLRLSFISHSNRDSFQRVGGGWGVLH